MGGSADLYRSYKQKETRAFNILFDHSEWKKWSFRQLVQRAQCKLSSLGPREGEFVSLLKNTIECRKEIFTEFLHAPDIRKAQHRYVIVCYRRILSSLPNLSPQSADLEQVSICEKPSDQSDEALESPLPECGDHYSLEESSDHVQDYLLFDIIEKYIDTILHLWQLAREDTLSILSATTISNCIYREMRSLLHAEDLLSNVEDVTTSHHPLLSRLRSAACTLSALPKAREFGDGDASHIRRQLSWCLSAERAWSPSICSQLVQDVCDRSGSAVLSAMISIYLLSELQWAKESRLLQAATEMRISYLEHLVLRKGHLLKRSAEWLLFVSSVKGRIASCPYPWVLGNIITWAEANMLNIFDTILSEPLVPAYVHVYQHLRNTAAIEPGEDIEYLCDRSHLLLFWDRRRPCDEKSLEISFSQWIATVTPTTASRIAKSRFEENLAFCIGSNDWCISQVAAEKNGLPRVDYLDAGFVSSLQASLEESRGQIDTFALSRLIYKGLEGLGSLAATEPPELRLWDMREHSEAIRLFPLQCERLSSCMKEVCLYCKKAIGHAYFLCSMCGYATYCGRTCQKASWPLHRRYCSNPRREDQLA